MIKVNKNFWIFTFGALVFSFSLKNFTNAYKPEAPKVAIANYEKLLKNLPSFNQSEEEFKKFVNTQQKIQTEEMEALKKLEDDFKKNEKNLSTAERDLRKKNIDEKKRDLQKRMMEIQMELQDKNTEVMDKLKKDLDEKFVDPFAKKNNIDIILDSESVAKLYNKNLDITDEVLNIMKKSTNSTTSTAKK